MREFTMISTRSLNVRLVSLLWRDIVAKVSSVLVCRNQCHPWCAFVRMVMVNTFKAAGVLSAAVCHVLSPTRFAQVFQSVVVALAVFVVNFVFGPTTIIIQPRKPRGFVQNAIDANVSISLYINRARNKALSGFAAATNAPTEHSANGVIRKQFTQSFRSQHFDILSLAQKIVNA